MTENLHRLLALALLVALGCGAYWLIDRVWLGRYEYYQTNADQAVDRLERFTALAAARPALQQRLESASQDQSSARFYLADKAPNLAATELQQQVRELVERNGGRLASTQVLPVSNEAGFTRVAIRVQLLVTDMEVLQKTLHALESSRPLLFIDDLQMRARTVRQRVAVDRSRLRRDPRTRRVQRPPVKTETQLTAQFELAGFLPKQGA